MPNYSGKPRVSFCWLSQLAQKASRALLEHGQIHTKLGWTAARPWSTSARCPNRHFMQAVREWGAARPHSSCIGVRWYSMVTAKSIFRVATCSGIVFGISYHFLKEYAWWPSGKPRVSFCWPSQQFQHFCLTFGLLLIGGLSAPVSHALLSQALPNRLPTLMRLRWQKGRSKEQLIVMCLMWHEGWCYVMKCCTCQECLRVPPLWEQATAPELARSWHASAFRAQKSFIDNIWKCSLSLDSSLHLSRQKGEEFMQKIRAPASQSPFENGLRVYDSFWLREQVSKGACK